MLVFSIGWRIGILYFPMVSLHGILLTRCSFTKTILGSKEPSSDGLQPTSDALVLATSSLVPCYDLVSKNESRLRVASGDGR